MYFLRTLVFMLTLVCCCMAPCGAGVELASLKREVAGSSLRSDMGFSLPEGVNKTQLRTLGWCQAEGQPTLKFNLLSSPSVPTPSRDITAR